MKKVFLNNKRIWIAALLIVILSASGLSTYAYYSSNTGTLTNNLSIATVTTEILEVPPTISGTRINKAPEVKNNGSVDCLVRVRITVSPESLDGPAVFHEMDTNKWKKVGVYYYYMGVVAPNGTTEKIFTYITGLTGPDSKFLTSLNVELKDFQITIYQEAVQAVVYDSNGNETSALDSNGVFSETNATAIWNRYDNP